MKGSCLCLDSFAYIIKYLDLDRLWLLSLATTELYDLVKDAITVKFIEGVASGQIHKRSIHSKLRSMSLNSLLSFVIDVSKVDVDRLVSGYTEDERVRLFIGICAFIYGEIVTELWTRSYQASREDITELRVKIYQALVKDQFILSRFLFTLGYYKEAINLEFDVVTRCISSALILECNIGMIIDGLIEDLRADKLTRKSRRDLINQEYMTMFAVIENICRHFYHIHNHVGINLTHPDRDIVTAEVEKFSIKCQILSGIICEL